MPTQNWRKQLVDKLENYTEDGGFVIYTNDELDVDLIDSFFTSKLEEIKQEIYNCTLNPKDEYMKGYNHGVSNALQILTRWIGK